MFFFFLNPEICLHKINISISQLAILYSSFSAGSHGNCTGMRFRDSVRCNFQPINLKGLKLQWVVSKLVHAPLFISKTSTGSHGTVVPCDSVQANALHLQSVFEVSLGICIHVVLETHVKCTPKKTIHHNTHMVAEAMWCE